MESFTITLSGTASTLEAHYFPPIELSPKKTYVLGLVEFLTFNSVPNVDDYNNKLYLKNHNIVIPTGNYEISNLEEYIKKKLSEHDISFSLKPNNNTLHSEIKCSEEINFEPPDSIGQLLGFTQRVLKPNVLHTSDKPVFIIKINSLRIECNITAGAYLNSKKSHTIHEFFPSVPAGYKIIEIPSQVIYLPITVKSIDFLQLRIVDQDGDIVNFRGEVITIRLHIKEIS